MMCLACSASYSPRAVVGILPDIVCAFEFPAFAIVSCPPFDCADLLAEGEVRGDDAEYERDGGEEEVGGGHDPCFCMNGYRRNRSGVEVFLES